MSMGKWRYTNHINLARLTGNKEQETTMEDRTEYLADDPCIVTCPACDHEQDEAECFIGRLGWLTHYRCRYCGMGFSIAPERNK
jgi:hypothetical protein